MLQQDEPWKCYAKWKKSVTEGQTLYDSTHRKYAEKANSQKQSTSEITKGWGKGYGTYWLMGTEFLFEVMEKFWRWMVVMAVQHCEGN